MVMGMSDADIKKLFGTKPDLADAITKSDVQLKRFDSDPPRYELTWFHIGGNTPISLNGDELWSWAIVQKAIFKVWKQVIDDMKPSDWHKLLTILNNNQVDADEPRASMAAEVLDILENWTERSKSLKWSAGDIIHRAIYKDGYFYFKMATFESGALFAQNSRFYYRRYDMPRQKVHEILKKAGAKTLVKKFKGKGIWVWQIPEDFNKPDELPQGELTPDNDGNNSEEHKVEPERTDEIPPDF